MNYLGVLTGAILLTTPAMVLHVLPQLRISAEPVISASSWSAPSDVFRSSRRACERNSASVPELGDLSHASAVFSRDARYAFVFGRDGGLSKVDLLTGRLENRVVQAGNSIGGAISQDGTLVAVSNYEPGGVRVFDAGTLAAGRRHPRPASKVVGLVDAPASASCSACTMPARSGSRT